MPVLTRAQIPVVTDQLAPFPFRERPYLFWVAIFLLATLGAFIFAEYSDAPRTYLFYCVLYAVSFLTVPLAFRFVRDIALDWSRNAKNFILPQRADDGSRVSDIDKWLVREFRFLGGSPKMYFVGAVIAIAAIPIVLSSRGSYHAGVDNPAEIFALVNRSCGLFVAGLGLYAIYGAFRSIWRLGSFKVRVTEHKFGILSTGAALARCYFVIALVWAIYASAVLVGVKNFSADISAAKLPIIALTLPTLVFIVGAFVISQFPLHKRMIDFKLTELVRIEGILDKLRPATSRALTPDIKSKIEFFERRKADVVSLPEWPFGFKSILAAIGSGLTVVFSAAASWLVPAIAQAAGSIFK